MATTSKTTRAKAATAATPDKAYLVDIDPADVLAHPSNVRKDLGDLTELAASITGSDTGILQYPVLTPTDDGGLRIIAGHRRLAAAQAAGITSQTCVVRPDLAGRDPEQIASMLVENIHRLNLSAHEEANGYAQLALFDGWDAERIATRIGVDIEVVNRQFALAKMPAKAAALTAAGNMTLQDAADLDALGDPKLVEKILAKGEGNTWAIRHEINEVKTKRDAIAKADAEQARYAEMGFPLLAKPKGWPYSSREMQLSQLKDAGGNRVTPEAVAGQPGYGMFIEKTNGRPNIVLICIDPEASGYKPERGYYNRYESPADIERKAREKAEREAFLAALATTGEVRRRFITDTYGTAKAVKALIRTVLRDAAISPGVLACDPGSLLTSLAGVDPDQLDDNASVDRAQRVLVARWLCRREDAVSRVGGGYNRQSFGPAVLAHLAMLVGDGYALAEAEQQLIEEVRPGRESVDQLDAPCRECGVATSEPCRAACELQPVRESVDQTDLRCRRCHADLGEACKRHCELQPARESVDQTDLRCRHCDADAGDECDDWCDLQPSRENPTQIDRYCQECDAEPGTECADECTLRATAPAAAEPSDADPDEAADTAEAVDADDDTERADELADDDQGDLATE